MKTKTVFRIAFISICVFIVIAAYFWYLYFGAFEGKVLAKNVRLEIVNSGNINYINAKIDDEDNVIPVYYFRVINHAKEKASYQLVLEDVAPSKVNDGCSEGTLFKRNELKYELKKDNRVLKRGILSELQDSLLDDAIAQEDSFYDYSLRIWLNDNADDSSKYHYHYTVSLKEKE